MKRIPGLNLAWTPSKEKNLRLAMKKAYRSLNGVSAIYFRISKNVGIKFFREWYQARDAQRTQAYWYKKNIAPRVGGDIVKMTVCDGDEMYGYITEHVPVRTVPRHKFHEFVDEYDREFIDIDRSHNVGILNKKVVVYDFDGVSMGDDCDLEGEDLGHKFKILKKGYNKHAFTTSQASDRA